MKHYQAFNKSLTYMQLIVTLVFIYVTMLIILYIVENSILRI